MELRRDPISQNWVIQEEESENWLSDDECWFCPGNERNSPLTIYEHRKGGGPWRVRVTPHPRPLYRIEEEAKRRGEGVYDKMRGQGAHEVLVEHPEHDCTLTRQSDEHVAQVVRACVSRINDLKRDSRFRYVTVFRNQGVMAGQDIEHPHMQITATPFIPRRVVYELRSFMRHYEIKERCLLCDIVKQELTQQQRAVEWDDMFVAFCPFASRVPFETWIVPQNHHAAFEKDLDPWERQLRFARMLRSVLRRVETITPEHQLALHTIPNLTAKYDKTSHWKSVTDDFHWHLEILPVSKTKSKSYGMKEVYYNSLLPEKAAEQLREVAVGR